MAAQLEAQEKTFNKITELCTNYKKDGPSRKTVDYLTKKLVALENLWMEFEERHKELSGLEVKSNAYFTENIYEKSKGLYDTTKRNILELLCSSGKEQQTSTHLEETVGGNDNSMEMGARETSRKIAEKFSQQKSNFRALERAFNKTNVRKLKEKWEMEDYLSTIKTKWEAVEKLHWELDGLLVSFDCDYEETYADLENCYDNTRKEIGSKIWANVHYEKSTPKIEVPEFYGNYEHWVSFKDLFIETIHNNPLISKAQKMQHLKTKLRGEAQRLVSHLHISADNYDSCWDTLTHRYENRNKLFDSYMDTLTGLPNIQQASVYNIKRMHDVMAECLNGLNNMGYDVITWDPVIAYLMRQKLDSATLAEYNKDRKEKREVATLTELTDFLEGKFMSLENNQRNHHKAESSNRYPNTSKSGGYSKSLHTSTYKKLSCGLCKKDGHATADCRALINMDSSARRAAITRLQLCQRCLVDHGDSACRSTQTCRTCNAPHHTLLHGSAYNKNNHQQGPKGHVQKYRKAYHASGGDNEILLATVLLRIRSVDGRWMDLRALLDMGSQVTLITENAAQLLKLPRRKLAATIQGVGSAAANCKGAVQLECKSMYSTYMFETDAMVTKKLIGNVPNITFKDIKWPHIRDLELADPEYNISRSVDLLLGAEVYSRIIMEGVRKGGRSSPTAMQTQLGWVLCGKTMTTFKCHATVLDTENLARFWETEEINPDVGDISDNDLCEEFYKKTTTREQDGTYVVQMPLHPDAAEKLGRSRNKAVAQFLQQERKFVKNEKLATMYKDFINEYKDLRHMKLSKPSSSNAMVSYLPHHGVLRESSTTTKLRVVFNASIKTDSKWSLNDLMHKGPNLQADIQALIIQWRSYKYVFTADVEKMYRCIKIHESQQPLQKIIWRDSPNEELQDMQLCTVTYGTKCAPFLAMRTLKQLVMDDGHMYPEAVERARNQFYMDDLISGADTLESALMAQQQLLMLLKRGGFNMRKWSANCQQLVEKLSDDQIATTGMFDFKQEDSMKTLGVAWNPKTDMFLFNWGLKGEAMEKLTKRVLLSEIAQLYDPLGWIAPVTIAAKLLFQRVWLSDVSWDGQLSPELREEWTRLRENLPKIKQIKLRRWVGSTCKQMQLHGFCDASEKAYACVVYSRIQGEDGQEKVTLIAAKTKVAPLKQKATIPRLELCGALLLATLMAKIKKGFTEKEVSTFGWCDSKVVLAWLQGEATKWEKYVANRVSKIKEVIPAEGWRYVKSEENPADCASRGMLPENLVDFGLWWQGPKWLHDWDSQEGEKSCYTTETGRVKKEYATYVVASEQENFLQTLLGKYSSLTHLQRVTAWVLRFIHNLRHKESNVGYLTITEMNESLQYIVRHVQRSSLADEYKQLVRGDMVAKKSAIYKLDPFLDERGIIRIGGRLQNSNLVYNMKKPIVLPNKGRFTQLVIEDAHYKTLHGGARLTLARIRYSFWIIGGNRAVKSQLRQCVRCHRFRTTDYAQQMADLPEQRVTPSRPFTHTGVDFTGSVDVRLSKGRGIRTSKGYIAVFVCMATKAVHIELVSDLSTESFIGAFKRMCARRGVPRFCYSDNGTNFVGAARVIKQDFIDFKRILTEEFFKEISEMKVDWKFNAPAWPSAGGLWEAAVKSMKHHLKRVLGEQKLTYEEFTTLLAQIEACMNSRPLCQLTEDPDEFYNHLTPGHFLTGSPNMLLPQRDSMEDGSINLRKLIITRARARNYKAR